MSGSAPFNPWKTFYESPEEQAAIKERAKYREAMKAEYRKVLTNPFKPPTGTLHDPALQRWYSARVTHAEYLQPSPKMGLLFGAVFAFFGTLFLAFNSRRTKVLKQIETGELSYEDRALKFLGK
ncbi:NADH dehydrogenase ubiquinone 1 beta [Fasciola hepatica]|uniref:NADH dehydrogenase [ubiquinone] 1 beta subcomplex subunit 4 n=1 Tax=Fasciola hepatica TaxID=6192 RepID=A0A4E0R115_FASHE|nr:NADH dehydrogenase ubiquinone 1 beta [Fasciola hepatica]